MYCAFNIPLSFHNITDSGLPQCFFSNVYFNGYVI